MDRLAWSKNQDSAIVHFFKDGDLGLKLVDLTSGKEEIVFSEKFNPSGRPPNLILSINWPAYSDRIYWIQGANIYELNLTTRELRMLYDGCKGNKFVTITKSTKNNTLIGGWRKETVVTPDDTLLIESFLLHLDLDLVYPHATKRLDIDW